MFLREIKYHVHIPYSCKKSGGNFYHNNETYLIFNFVAELTNSSRLKTKVDQFLLPHCKVTKNTIIAIYSVNRLN